MITIQRKVNQKDSSEILHDVYFNFPCEHLHIIDQLWIKYSNGHFGFSVQKRIYQSLGETTNYDDEEWLVAFVDRVGWKEDISGDIVAFFDRVGCKEDESGNIVFVFGMEAPLVDLTFLVPLAHLPFLFLVVGAVGLVDDIWGNDVWGNGVDFRKFYSRVKTCKV